MLENIELRAQVTSILMFGESHSLAFKDLLFSAQDGKDFFLCRNRFVPKLLASEYSAENGLSVLLADTLVSEGILDKGLRPAFLNLDPSAAYISGQPLIAPPIVFFACDTELIFVLDKLADQYDFSLPDDPGYGVDRTKQPVPYKDIVAQLHSIIDPFLRSLAMLKAVGFSRLMVHCLPPRNADEDAACVFTGGVKIPRSVRAKAAMLANRILKEGCSRHGIAFLDTWQEMSCDGYLRPELALDGIHFNRRAALISLAKIVECLLNPTQDTFNAVRYKQLNAQAARRTQVTASAEWESQGYVIDDFSESALPAIDGQFSMLEKRYPKRLDWLGWFGGMPASLHGVASAELPLENLYALVTQPDFDSFLHAGSAAELTVSNVRCRALTDGSDLQTELGRNFPEGVRCAVLFLNGGGLMRALSRGSSEAEIQISKGVALVYDPSKIQLQMTPTSGEIWAIEFSLMPRLSGQPMRVMASGAYDWPCDPFQYSVEAMEVYPAMETSDFSARAHWL